MPLTLTSIVKPESTLLADMTPVDPKNGITLADAKAIVAYLNSLPCITVDVELRAFPRVSIMDETYWTEKQIVANEAEKLSLNIYLVGHITLLTKSSETYNNVPVSVTKEIRYNAANAGLLLTSPQIMVTSIEAFLHTLDFSLPHLILWQANWPEVKTTIKEVLARY